MRKILKKIDCKGTDLPPPEIIGEIKNAFRDKGIGFSGVFYEVKSKQGYVWIDRIPMEVA